MKFKSNALVGKSCFSVLVLLFCLCDRSHAVGTFSSLRVLADCKQIEASVASPTNRFQFVYHESARHIIEVGSKRPVKLTIHGNVVLFQWGEALLTVTDNSTYWNNRAVLSLDVGKTEKKEMRCELDSAAINQLAVNSDAAIGARRDR